MHAPEIEFVHRTSLARIGAAQEFYTKCSRRYTCPAYENRAYHLGLLWSICYSLAMTARILDGIKIRDEIFAELKMEVAQLAAQGVRPGLAAVLVGENPASQLYVKSKVAACEQLVMPIWLHTPTAHFTTEYMLQLVDDLNPHDNVDEILVHLP